MKWRFEWVYRLCLAAFFIVATWAVWSEAQGMPGAISPGLAVGKTNQVAQVSVTNAPGVVTVQTKIFRPPWPESGLSFGLDQVTVLRETTFLDQPLWKYIAFLVYIILAFYVAKLLDVLVNVWLKRLTVKTKTEKDDLVLDLLRGPVKMVAFVIFLHIGLSLFDWPEHAQLLLSRGLIVVVACSVTYLALKLVDLLLGLWQEQIVAPQDRVFAKQLLPLVSKVSKAGLLIAAVLLTADNLDIKITSALAGLSVGGLALGLAAQDTVANLFGAVAIFLDKPFYIGDVIRVESVEGVVEGIGLRSTRVRNGDGHHVSIPNKLMGNAIITNITRRPTIKSQINLGLTYDTPAKQVARAVAWLEEIFRGNPKTKDVIISFNKFGDSALNILVVHEWSGADVKEHLTAMQALNLQIKERFDAEKIEFAFPTQTVYLKQESQQMDLPPAAGCG
jgi:MscS family membrane protein